MEYSFIFAGSIWSIVFKSLVSLLTFCFDVLPIKRQGKILCNDKSINTTEKYNNFKYIYVPNIRAPKSIKPTLTDLKGEIGSNTIIVGEFNIPFSIMNTFSKPFMSEIVFLKSDNLV